MTAGAVALVHAAPSAPSDDGEEGAAAHGVTPLEIRRGVAPGTMQPPPALAGATRHAAVGSASGTSMGVTKLSWNEPT